MPDHKWQDTRDDRKVLDRLQHELLGRFLFAVSPGRTDNGEWCLQIEDSAEYQVEVIKELSFFYVINRPSLAMVQRGQKRIIAKLFDDLMDMFVHHRNEKKDPDFPVPTLMDDLYDSMVKHEKMSKFARGDEERRARAVCDYICALTENQAINLYERITGHRVSQGSIFGTWF